ncbi:MAG: EAL domain-containing protein [Myxococcota bacterium]
MELASKLGMRARLSINFLPNAVYEPRACIQATLQAAAEFDFDPRQIMFEITEGEQIVDLAHVKRILRTYRELGFCTAIDDFGAGYAGLGLLADYQPDVVKLDMAIVRHVDREKPRRVICRAAADMAAELGVRLVAEGVETVGEFETLQALGVELFQGYLFAKPGFENLPEVKGFLEPTTS